MKTAYFLYDFHRFSFISIINFFLVGIFLSLNSIEVAAQLTTGTYNLQPSLSLNQTASERAVPKSKHLSTGLYYQKFVSKNILLGVGFDYTSSIGIIPSPFQFLYQKRRTYSLPHELRIYLNQGPSWYVFLGMRNRFRAVRAIFLNELEFSPFIPGIEPPENQAGFSSAVYLGLNKAIGDNAYWELKLQSSLLTPNFEINERGFSINNSFKVFLNQAWQWKTDSLENRFLKAGNMFITGQANLFFSYEESRNRTIFINPTIESFVSDHWTLRTEFSLFYQRIEEEFSFYVASTLTMSVFAQVAPQFYLRPILGFGFSQEISAYYMPISLELNYFSPQARWYHGYTYTRYAGFSFSTFANQNQLRIYGGVDYFILPNVFIRGNIDYEMVNLADLPTGNGLFGPNSLKWFKPEIGIHFML